MKCLWDRAALGLFALLALLVAATFRDYGLSWDEPFHMEYGARLLRYYATLGRDTAAFDYINLYLYGGLFDAPVALLAPRLPFDLVDARHLLIALTGLAGILGSWRLGRLLGGPRAGFLAALLLATMPGWWGHMFINPKDIPFGTAMIWAVYFMARLARATPRPSPRDALFFGLCAGLAMGLRIGGVLLFVYLATVLGLWFLLSLLLRGAPRALLREAIAVLPAPLGAAAVAWIVMVIAWPWALDAPLHHPWEALTTFSRFPFNTPVLLDGRWIDSTALPMGYLPLMIAIKVPLPHLLSAGALLLFAGRAVHVVRRQLAQGDAAWLGWATVATALLLPVAYVLVSRPVLYNEMRHFLFILPPLAVLAGLGMDRLWRRLDSFPVAARLAAGALVAVCFSLHLLTLTRLHPYEYVAYNRVVGGVAGAARRFDLDYWSTSFREVYATMKERIREREGEAALHRPWRVRFCGAPEASLRYIEKEWRPVWPGVEGAADFEVGGTGPACPPPEGPLMVEVRRDGALLGYARDLRR